MRLDHLLSKECRRPFVPTTTQLNTGYSAALAHRRMNRPPPMVTQWCSHRRRGRSEPALHGPFPARSTGLSLFRFEGVTLRVGPGDVPACASSAASGPLTPCVPRPGSRLRPAICAGRRARPRRALCSPLRIPKRARASLFSKLQRANGGCLGA